MLIEPIQKPYSGKLILDIMLSLNYKCLKIITLNNLIIKIAIIQTYTCIE